MKSTSQALAEKLCRGCILVLACVFGTAWLYAQPVAAATNTPATTDLTFRPDIAGGIITQFFPQPFVNAVAVQADGKILVGGNFTELRGQTRNFIARLNPDGTLDEGFNPGANHWVDTIAVQPDGKILLGGTFSELGGHTRYRLGRLHPDGTVEDSFDPGLAGDIFQGIFLTFVRSFVVQPDGKILVGGEFAALGGLSAKHARRRIGRLLPNGQLDGKFNPGADGQVFALALQTNGMVLMGGDFTNVQKKARSRIARVTSKGKLDKEFIPAANQRVNTLAVQGDGKILVGGGFTSLVGHSRNRIGRLHPDGSVDESFNPNANSSVIAIALQADGRILIGGYFSNVAGQTRRGLARLHPDGSLDTSFAAPVNGAVYGMALQENGSVVAVGEFTTLGGQPRKSIGRILNTEPPEQSLTYAAPSLVWTRGGTAPEFWRTTFESTTDGLTWTNLGSGQRVTEGWSLDVHLPAAASVRARGYVAGGTESASWFVDNYFGKPIIVSQPGILTNGPTTTATLAIQSGGSEPLSYQWFRNGVALVDQGNLSGANAATLVLTNLLGADAGAYSVIVSNAFGSVTSALSHLIVPNPFIVQQPLGAHRNAGESVTLSVSAVGAPAPGYQWFLDGVSVPGATNASLTLSNLTASDAGSYAVGIINTEGAITSQAAWVDVNTFFPDYYFTASAEGAEPSVRSIVELPDGKLLVGGEFTTFNGWFPSNFRRINSDGTTDSTPIAEADWSVFSILRQSDGKILVGGGFLGLGNQLREGLGRLNSDGSLDTNFDPQVNGGDGAFYQDSLDGTVVQSMALQSDGKIVFAGNFKTVAGRSRARVARLNADGTLDLTFAPGATGGAFADVYSIAIQENGRIVVAGEFTKLSGAQRKFLGRLTETGKFDPTFLPTVDAPVRCMALLPGGKVLIGGEFTTVNGQQRTCLAQLNADGTLDTTFSRDANGVVYTLLRQPDGKVLLGGNFSVLDGRTRIGVARLNADGTLDEHFCPAVDGTVRSLALDSNGAVLVGGIFYSVAGDSRECIARLIERLPMSPALAHQQSIVAPAAVDGSTRRLSGVVATTDIQPTNVEIPVSGVIQLQMVRSGFTVVLSWTGGEGPYQVQHTDDLKDPSSWQDLGDPVPGNSLSLPIGSGTRFLRVIGR